MLAIDLTGRTAVVTGGSGELGRVMVRTLARAGADVVIGYHSNRAGAEALAQQVAALGRRVSPEQVDVADLGSVLALRDRVAEAFGPADIIVNNAVVQYTWVSVLEQSPDDYASQFRSCVLHAVHMAKAFVPAMRERGWGRVIGINTECAMQCRPSQSAYAAAKRGMDGVLRVLAREVGSAGITVNQVAPGWTVSENRPAGDGQGEADYVRGVPLRRRGADQEIANVVAFLASDLASFITGAYVPVCGGNVMPTI